uniref:HMG box domain-containing protein n=1 Tax=Panagrolaimus sp. JU765 TaxID=591449 RepID=A0AC34QW70_9BILA
MAKQTGTKKKVIKKKDPNAPKRAMSAFFFWMGENRERIKKPGMSVADIAKQAGVEWGKLQDKSKWEKMAEQDKKRYESEISEYLKSRHVGLIIYLVRIEFLYIPRYRPIVNTVLY